MSDKNRVLDYLREHGSITPMEALNSFGCYRLGARIWDLRNEGHDITTEMVEGKDQHGDPMRYAKYRLNEAAVTTVTTFNTPYDLLHEEGGCYLQ